MEIFLAAALKPLVILGMLYLVLSPARKAVEKFMPEGKLKRWLLSDFI